MTFDEINKIAVKYGCKVQTWKTTYDCQELDKFMISYGGIIFVTSYFWRLYEFHNKELICVSNRIIERKGNVFKISEAVLIMTIESIIKAVKNKKEHEKINEIEQDFNDG